ncbi:hypothetical protein MSAN_01649800 [Mycena sanguinolenta]|uniref:Uncharacterized protein n=1 Tax=Mycena sanguinolenta TaxID=230812 RepID=A0A8H7CWL3_9AGAR|nr:hypothetical protein MSAN_01649800 [Mycena sanguinolenta]
MLASSRAYHSTMSQHARNKIISALAQYPLHGLESPEDDISKILQQSYRPLSVPMADSSGAVSTPSDHYDEDAENIDPNSSENQLTHHPVSRTVANVLCDSQAHTVPASSAHNPISQYARAQVAESIAAPVPLPYSARSKEVLSSMISPTQPAGFSRPVPQGYNFNKNLIYSAGYTQTNHASETGPNIRSNASGGLQYHDSHGIAPRPSIRSVSPATMIALTEPFLMAWIDNYPPLRPLPYFNYP